LLQAIAEKDVPVYIDFFAHMSLWEGIRTAGAKAIYFLHNNTAHLEKMLRKHGPGIILIDSLYSTTGDIAPIAQIAKLSQQYKCIYVVDESHSVGTRGGKLSAGLWENKIRLVLVSLPIVLFVALQPKALSSQAFSTRSLGQTMDLGLSRNAVAPVKFVLNSENRELIDWIRLFAQNAEPEVYQGMKAKITGFVLNDQNLPENHFTLARFVISCCAADARPVGLTVKYDPAMFKASNDQWVEIKGEFIIEEINGETNEDLNNLVLQPRRMSLSITTTSGIRCLLAKRVASIILGEITTVLVRFSSIKDNAEAV
jgi:uncharacterized repeat protein (TIGR03943 family)